MLVVVYPSQISWKQLYEYGVNLLLIKLSNFQGFLLYLYLEFDVATINGKLVFSHKYLDS